MTRIPKVMAVALAIAALGAACTSGKGSSSVAATVAAGSSSPTPDWPGEDPLALEGAWTTGDLTPAEIKHRALNYAEERCIDAFIGGADSITWDLYIRNGSWVLYRADNEGSADDVDGGTVARYFDGSALFEAAGGRAHRDNYWMYVRQHDGGFTMNLLRLDELDPGQGDTTCFVKAAVAVELTNTFMPKM